MHTLTKVLHNLDRDCYLFVNNTYEESTETRNGLYVLLFKFNSKSPYETWKLKAESVSENKKDQ